MPGGHGGSLVIDCTETGSNRSETSVAIGAEDQTAPTALMDFPEQVRPAQGRGQEGVHEAITAPRHGGDERGDWR